jgi:phospholipid/cholesterol/gamma-HCH transport system permease protein
MYKAFRETCELVGYEIVLLWQSVLRLPHLWRRRAATLDHLFVAGVGVVHVILFVGLFTGMILTLQTGIELSRFGQQDQIGTIVALSMAREMGPFITGIILAATAGSALAAELGTMKISDELSALEILSVDRIDYLVMPRIVALAIACPLLTVLCDLIGVLGGGLVASAQLGVETQFYFDSAVEALKTPDAFLTLPKDVYTGLFKSFVFGLIIATIACSCGIRASGGALGVGQATRRAVRDSIVLIIVANYFLTYFFYSFLPEIA